MRKVQKKDERCPMQATGETANRSGHSNHRCQGGFPFALLISFSLAFFHPSSNFQMVFPFALLISFSRAFLTFFHPSSNFQGVQKDINMLNGKLERSFFEICMGMKAKIRNKEPYVEHSMGLLRLSCSIFALPFPTLLEHAFLVKISSNIFCCWLLTVDSARDTSWD